MATSETRDLLAERIRRLETRISELGNQVASTGENVQRALRQLDALVSLIGRLGRVVDVQGRILQGDEDQLERKVGEVERRMLELAGGLTAVRSRLDASDAVGRKRRPSSPVAPVKAAPRRSSKPRKR